MKLSIGIPFYNAENYLIDAIRSIFAQTWQDWELLLVDDGSTDNSLSIANSIKDPRVRVISDGCNRKLPYRLNQITREAKGEYLARMDADDLISPLRFEKQIKILDSCKEIDLVTTGICSITNDNRPTGIRNKTVHEIISGRNLLLGKCSIVHAAMMGRKSWFERNTYDETAILTEDYELWLRAFSKNDLNISIMRDHLYYYREENNVSSAKMLKAYKKQIEIIHQYKTLGESRFWIAVTISKFIIKSFIVIVLDKVNMTKILLKKRNKPITDKYLLKHFIQEIRTIQNTDIPL